MLKKRDIVISPFVSDLPGKHWNMNYKDVLKAPLSANQDIYKERELLQEEKELYSAIFVMWQMQVIIGRE